MAEAFILFQVAGATYAVPSELVRMVDMVETITRVPNAPDFIEGVVAVRGQVIPVVSIRRRFHLEPVPVDLRTRLIVVQLDTRFIGMMVNSAREFVQINTELVQPPPETLRGALVEYLDGVITHNQRMVLIVNLQRLFASDEREDLARPLDGESRAELAPRS